MKALIILMSLFLFVQSEPMDITISNDIATWRSTGGIMDFYIFTGPSPAAVVRQYQSLIGPERILQISLINHIWYFTTA